MVSNSALAIGAFVAAEATGVTDFTGRGSGGGARGIGESMGRAFGGINIEMPGASRSPGSAFDQIQMPNFPKIEYPTVEYPEFPTVEYPEFPTVPEWEPPDFSEIDWPETITDPPIDINDDDSPTTSRYGGFNNPTLQDAERIVGGTGDVVDDITGAVGDPGDPESSSGIIGFSYDVGTLSADTLKSSYEAGQTVGDAVTSIGPILPEKKKGPKTWKSPGPNKFDEMVGLERDKSYNWEKYGSLTRKR